MGEFENRGDVRKKIKTRKNFYVFTLKKEKEKKNIEFLSNKFDFTLL